MFIKKFIFSIGFLFMVQVWAGVAAANACESTSSNNWRSPATWTNCGSTVPQSLDTVLIKDTHIVDLDVDTAELGGLTIEVGGGLDVRQRIVNPELGYSINLHSTAAQKIDVSNALINLSAHLTINAKGQDIWLGSVVGPFDIHLNSDGETRLMDVIGEELSYGEISLNNPTSFITNPIGTTVIDIPNENYNQTNIHVNGERIFNDDVLLVRNASFLASYNRIEPITFNGTVNTDSSGAFKSLFFHLLGNSILQFNKNVGEVKKLQSIQMVNTRGATIELNLSKMITHSNISLGGNILLNSLTETVLLENTTANNIGLGKDYVRTAPGANPNVLLINTMGGNIGIASVGDNNQPLSNLIINTTGTIKLGGTSVTTTLSQDYTGDVLLTKDIVLNSDQVTINNNIDTAGFDLILNTTDTSGATKIQGVLSGSGDLIKNGVGFLDFYSINTLTGNILLNEGLLYNRVESNTIFPNVPQLSLAADSTASLGHLSTGEYILGNNQSVNGNGLFTGNLIANSGAIVAPGLSPGTLSVDEINMASGSILSVEINGNAVGTEYDQLVLNQGGSIAGATLDLSFGFNPSIGDSFRIINSLSALSGTFSGLPEGSEFFAGDEVLSISYVAGSGNDVELTVVGTAIIHVDASAVNNGDGKSWATAFNNLQDALAVAVSGNKVWVTLGVYYPDVGGTQVNNDRLASFTLIDGVSIYGGFNGTETDLNQRDPELNVTVLSGDLEQDDVNSDGNNILEDRIDANGLNSHHIVNGSGVNTSTVFSGFTITAGQANGAGTNERHGAGMYCGLGFNGPSIGMSTFIGNYATFDGAATYGCSQDVSDSDFINNYSRNGGAIIIRGGYYENVLFQGNIVYGTGGAISKNSSPLKIVNSQFIANQAFGNGGAINSVNGVTLENVLFSGNKSNSSGGAIHQSGSSSNLTNVTMTGNLATNSGGAINLTNSVTLNIRNSIIWNNHDSTTDTTVSSSIHVNGGTYTQTNSLVQNFPTSGVGNLDVDPLFITDTDPSTAPTSLGNAHLNVGSPAINMGDNSLVTPLITDLDGNSRIQDTTVDMGVYEFSSHTVSVSVSGLSGDQLVLQNNGTDDLIFNNDATQVFAIPVAYTDDYSVTVLTQPTSPNQECLVSDPTGTINESDVTVNVICTTFYNVGVDVSGLADGVTLSLLNNAESLDVTSNDPINFATAILDGSAYAVSVETSPSSPNQECLITSNNASGSINGTDVVVDIECTTLQYNVGVDVFGLADRVTLSVLNNSEALNVTNNGTTNFATALDDGSAYAVSVTSNPSNPNQECLITSNNASGFISGGEIEVTIQCSISQYSVGVDVTGLANGATLSLLNNSDPLEVTADGQFNFAIALDDLSAYVVSVTSQPTNPIQTCFVTGGNSGANDGSGTLTGANVQMNVKCNTQLTAVANIYTAFEDITLLANDAHGSVTGDNDDGVLVNDSDVDDDTIIVVAPGTYTATGIGGQVTLAADGTFSYVPPADISGQDVLTFDVTDGVHTVGSSLTIDVLPVNDAPTFSILGNVLSAELHPNIVGTTLTIPQFAFDMYAGADDESSQTLQFSESIFADSNAILDVNGVSITNAGELTLDFTGNIGLAIVQLTLQDDSLQTNGGEDTSVIAEFVVSFSDTLFVDDFEEQQVTKLFNVLDGIKSKSSLSNYPNYDEMSHSVNYYEHTLKLEEDYLTPQMIQVIEYWITEVEITRVTGSRLQVRGDRL